MGAKARGFLLFSFAFSSVLSYPELLISNETQTNAFNPEGPNNETNPTVNRGCSLDGTCRRDNSNIRKREISDTTVFSQIDLDKTFGGLQESDGFYNTLRNMISKKDVEKRSRVGFTGMRGKKDIERFNPMEDQSIADLVEKRNRIRLMGLRRMNRYGYDKRLERAFHGMRGKKDDMRYADDENEVITSVQNLLRNVLEGVNNVNNQENLRRLDSYKMSKASLPANPPLGQPVSWRNVMDSSSDNEFSSKLRNMNADMRRGAGDGAVYVRRGKRHVPDYTAERVDDNALDKEVNRSSRLNHLPHGSQRDMRSELNVISFK